MKFYNDFNSMFQAQSGLKSDMSVFNKVRHYDSSGEGDAYHVSDSGGKEYITVYLYGFCADQEYVFGEDEDEDEGRTITLIMTDGIDVTDEMIQSALLSANYSGKYRIEVNGYKSKVVLGDEELDWSAGEVADWFDRNVVNREDE